MGRLRIWQRAQLPGPIAVDWLRRGELSQDSAHSHTNTQTKILVGILSHKDGVSDHKSKHLHVCRTEQRK